MWIDALFNDALKNDEMPTIVLRETGLEIVLSLKRDSFILVSGFRKNRDGNAG